MIKDFCAGVAVLALILMVATWAVALQPIVQ